MSAELSPTLEFKKPEIGETVDLDAMSADERFTYLNEMNGGYYTEQGLTVDTLDDYLSGLEADQNPTSPEQAAEAEEVRAQVYELAADGKNADKNKVTQLALEVIGLIRRGGIKLATGMALLVVLAGCGPTTEATPSPDPEISASATPEAPEVNLEEVAAKFEIPTGLADQQLAETYISHVNDWYNFGTYPDMINDPRFAPLSVEDYGALIADETKETITETIYTEDNAEEGNDKSAIHANTIAKYVQSLLKGETPYTHNLELVSLDGVGDNGDQHVLLMTVSETSNDNEINNQFQIEVRFVVVGNTMKVQSDTIA